MTGTFRDPSGPDKSHNEAVIADNAFHRRLSGVRNREVMDNHPDIELLRREQQAQAQREIATLYNMSPVASKTGTESNNSLPVVSRRHTPEEGPFMSFDQAVFQLARETRRANKFLRPMSVMVIAFGELLPIATLHGVEVYERALLFGYAAVVSCLEQEIDVVGIYGNDRLLVVLPETHGAHAGCVAENIRLMFQSTPVEYKKHCFNFKPSIGIACLPIHGRDWKELIAKADLAADAVLEAGGDGYGFGPQ